MLTQIWSVIDIIVISGHFCSFAPLFMSKIKILKKYIILLHMCTINQEHMMYGSWDMKCDRQNFFVIFGHFSPFYPPERWKYQKWKKKPGDIIILYWLYCSRDMTCDGCNCYFHFGLYFSLLLPPNSPKNQNFIKMKKNPGDIIILHQCPKNHDHMLYCSWEMEHDKCNCYFSFWPILCPFTLFALLTTQKIKISKNKKSTPGDIIILHKCIKNYD